MTIESRKRVTTETVNVAVCDFCGAEEELNESDQWAIEPKVVETSRRGSEVIVLESVGERERYMHESRVQLRAEDTIQLCRYCSEVLRE